MSWPEASDAPFPRAVALATGYNISAPGANTNFLTSSHIHDGGSIWTMSGLCSVARITISLTTSSKLDLRVTDGSTAFSCVLNGDTALAAGGAYVFELPLRKTKDGTTNLQYNLRVQSDSVIRFVFVDEVIGGVA